MEPQIMGVAELIVVLVGPMMEVVPLMTLEKAEQSRVRVS